MLGNDLRVEAGVPGVWYPVNERVNVGTPPGGLELPATFEFVGDGDRVDRFAGGEQVADRLRDADVRFPVKVVRPKCFENLADRRFREHHRPENRLLGLEVVRRYASGYGRRVICESRRHPVATLNVGSDNNRCTTSTRRPHARPTFPQRCAARPQAVHKSP